jgi:hypothetical protein
MNDAGPNRELNHRTNQCWFSYLRQSCGGEELYYIYVGFQIPEFRIICEAHNKIRPDRSGMRKFISKCEWEFLQISEQLLRFTDLLPRDRNTMVVISLFGE